MKITRRQFFESGVAAFTVTFGAPELLSDLARAQSPHVRNLVVLYLGGGNDSLSTLIPYTDSFYYSRRPNLAVPAASVLQIGRDRSNAALGLHPRLSGIRQIFDGGRLALLQRTGYPNQSRSHFQGTDIWATANPESQQGFGWVGRHLDSLPSPVDALVGWNTTRDLPRVLQANHVSVPAIPNPVTYSFASPNTGAEAAAGPGVERESGRCGVVGAETLIEPAEQVGQDGTPRIEVVAARPVGDDQGRVRRVDHRGEGPQVTLGHSVVEPGGHAVAAAPGLARLRAAR